MFNEYFKGNKYVSYLLGGIIMTQDKIEEFKEDAQKAAGNENAEEKVDSLQNDNKGEEKTKEDIQQTFE